ncbi:MAG: type I-E CRISPR-associated protein Cse2/CasB [Desulfovibrionaceae bacterium]
MATPLTFTGDPGEKARAVLHAWWLGLETRRGDRAELRRAATPADVILCEGFYHLLNDLRDDYAISPRSLPKLALVAGVTAHVRTEDARPFAKQLASPKDGGSSAAMSGLRFRRLLQTDAADPDALFVALVRAVRLAGNRANLASLANAAYWWNEKLRRDWAVDYYATASNKAS